MEDEQGNRSTPLSAYWIDGPSVHQSDQLEEVGRYGQSNFKKACTGREGGGYL